MIGQRKTSFKNLAWNTQDESNAYSKMLPTTRYAPGAYPPSLAFPQLGGANVQRYFQKFDACPKATWHR